jgi:hypothetical protein
MPVWTVPQSYDCAIGSAGKVTTSSKIQMTPEGLCETNKKFSTLAIGKHKPSKLRLC